MADVRVIDGVRRRAVRERRRAGAVLVLVLGAGCVVAGCRPAPMRMTSAGGETRAGSAVPATDGDEDADAAFDESDADESDADEASSARDGSTTPEVAEDEQPRRRRARRGRRGRRRGRGRGR